MGVLGYGLLGLGFGDAMFGYSMLRSMFIFRSLLACLDFASCIFNMLPLPFVLFLAYVWLHLFPLLLVLGVIACLRSYLDDVGMLLPCLSLLLSFAC